MHDGGLSQSEHPQSPRRELQASYQLPPGVPRHSHGLLLVKEATEASPDLGEKGEIAAPAPAPARHVGAARTSRREERNEGGRLWRGATH